MDFELKRDMVDKVIDIFLSKLIDKKLSSHIDSCVPKDIFGDEVSMSEQYYIWAADIIIEEGLAYVEGAGRFRANRKTRDIHAIGGYLKYIDMLKEEKKKNDKRLRLDNMYKIVTSIILSLTFILSLFSFLKGIFCK